jgi:hypothetical protein
MQSMLAGSFYGDLSLVLNPNIHLFIKKHSLTIDFSNLNTKMTRICFNLEKLGIFHLSNSVSLFFSIENSRATLARAVRGPCVGLREMTSTGGCSDDYKWRVCIYLVCGIATLNVFWCDFVVFTNVDLHIERIYFDDFGIKLFQS